jgi:glycosyltransferase involved in cell wall biosynthesis
MKILFFNYEYPPLGGGAGNASFYILKEFSKISELEIDFVTSSIDSEYHLEKMGEKINIHRLPIGKNKNNLHFQSQKDLLVYSWKAYFFARKLIKKNNYNLSHSFFTVPCGFLSLVLKWQYKIPYIVSLRGADVPGYAERFSFIYNLLKPVIKTIWKNSSAVVSNSQGLKDLALKSREGQEIDVIYNGIDTEQFFPKPELKNTMSQFIITTGASRVTQRKGLNYLIEAVAQLLPKDPNILVKIMGDGDAKDELEKLAKNLGIENNIKFIGRIPSENTTPHYQEASLFVLPSLNEGMSNAMLEALASGLPIIATDTGGTKELLNDGENGFIVKMKDSSDIAEKIEKLIQNPELRQKMASESRKIAENFSWKKVASQYAEIYKKITRK